MRCRNSPTELTRRLGGTLIAAGVGTAIGGLAGAAYGLLYGLLAGLLHGRLASVLIHGLYFAACGAVAGALVGVCARLVRETDPPPRRSTENPQPQRPQMSGRKSGVPTADELSPALQARITPRKGWTTRDFGN